MDVSFVGLGAMGYPMAGHLARKGHRVTVFNRTRSVAERHAVEFGSRAVQDLGEVASLLAIFTCLPTSREVDEVVRALGDRIRPGTVLVDCTSGDPATSRATAERLRARGIDFLDAPVSGGRNGAEQGTLTVMAGGDPAVLDRVREPLAAFAARVIHVGPVGCGHALKAINNTMLAIHILAAAEGLAALEHSGIEPLAVLEVLNASSGRSFVSEKLLPQPIASGEFPLNFKLGLLAKDVGIGEQVTKEGGHPSPVTELAAALLRKAKAEIGDDVDYLELVRWGGGEA